MSVVDFHHGQEVEVVFESFEVKVQNRGEAFKNDTLLGVLQAIGGTSIVLVLALECLHLNVISETVIQGLVTADIQLDIPKVFHEGGFVVNVDARDIGLCFSNKQLR